MTNVFLGGCFFTIFFTDFCWEIVGLFHTRGKTLNGHKNAQSIAYFMVKLSEHE